MGKGVKKMLSGIVLLWILYHMDAPWWCWLIACLAIVVKAVNAGIWLGKGKMELRDE